MAIIIDDSKPHQFNRNSLIDATNCLGNRLVALLLDYSLLVTVYLLIALNVDTDFVYWVPVYFIFVFLAESIFKGIIIQPV